MNNESLLDLDLSDMSIEALESLGAKLKSELQRRRDAEIALFREKAMSLANTFEMPYEELIRRLAETRRPRQRREVPAKYRHPETGETWTGRGLMPKWIRREVEAGKTVEMFRID